MGSVSPSTTRTRRFVEIGLFFQNQISSWTPILELGAQAGEVHLPNPAAVECVDEAYFIESGRLHKPRRGELNLWLTERTAFGDNH